MNILPALKAAIESADAALDALTSAEEAHGKAINALCALSGAKDYGEAQAAYMALAGEAAAKVERTGA